MIKVNGLDKYQYFKLIKNDSKSSEGNNSKIPNP